MQQRIEAIDQYRGIAVILMVIANYLADVTTIPGWLKHAPDIGLTVIDLIAPFFIFAIGLTYGDSYRARAERDGMGKAGGHFLRRFLALIGIGAIISAGEVLVGKSASPISWGVLQAIGVAGLATLLVIGLPPLWRALVGVAILGAYQLLLDVSWLSTVLHSEHGGLEGALSWSGMLILSTVIADVWRRNRVGEIGAAWPSAVSLAGGLLLSLVAPISKNRVSASYVLVSLGASGLLFSLVLLAVNRLGLRPAYLRWWGVNPLLLYIMHYLLLALVVLPDAPWWHVQASIPLVAAQAAAVIAVLSVAARLLSRREKPISL
ncbi:MAG TPA: heparan-alpha-glucosaminide N-acetyltransferase domain-containing protein [Spirochaetia bacterium]|nr:heparan-alpha-glucosaminide N-acetyltransferase domain-containing protein [Spirochaetia bacterium]